MNLKEYIKKYKTELLEKVIPFWEIYSIDKEFGGFFNSIDRDGSVFDTDKWMWMQWRTVYMFATLYNSPYRKNIWLEYAKQGFDFLKSHGKDENGMYYFALNREGKPIIAPYNIYTEAFAVMGSAVLYKATSDSIYKEEAISAIQHYLQRRDNPKGLWEKSLPARKQRLNLGIYMIFANLGILMKDCLKITEYDEKISESIDIIVRRFWNDEYKVLFENINLDYEFDLESYDGRQINPGHGLESCWFAMQYAENQERQDLIPKIAEIVKGLIVFGWDKKYGGLFYFMDVLGKPHLELQWDMKLWWVHNEAILATLFTYALTKDEYFLNWFEKIDEWTFNHFPDPKFPEWFAYLNRKGEPTHMLKAGKWKSFFHLPRCLLLSIEKMKLIEKTK